MQEDGKSTLVGELVTCAGIVPDRGECTKCLCSLISGKSADTHPGRSELKCQTLRLS